MRARKVLEHVTHNGDVIISMIEVKVQSHNMLNGIAMDSYDLLNFQFLILKCLVDFCHMACTYTADALAINLFYD